MGILNTTGQLAAATTAAAGAMTAAAAGGAIGAVGGAVSGISRGLNTGAKSTPIAILGVAAIGAAGIIDWPLLLAGGATVLLLRELKARRTPAQVTAPAAATPPEQEPPASTPKPAPKPRTARRRPAGQPVPTATR